MPTYIACFFISLMAIVSVMNVPRLEAANIAMVSDVIATNGIAYKSALVQYLNANPNFAGTIADASITLPQGLVRDARWSNVVANKTLYVYEKTPFNAPGLLGVIYAKTDKSIFVGINNGAQLVNATGYTTGVPIPVTAPPIPNGAIVLVGR